MIPPKYMYLQILLLTATMQVPHEHAKQNLAWGMEKGFNKK